ncbi:MAG: helix-turn-helix transcriptional regulator [Clostridia bacterium]|nr:helix-turn-helix transcriptional regulator [Clostridia bacterium]
MVNINKLKGKIVEKGMSIEKIAEKMGIDRATLYRKLNANGGNITIKDADKIALALDLSPSEAAAIFFSQYVA